MLCLVAGFGNGCLEPSLSSSKVFLISLHALLLSGMISAQDSVLELCTNARFLCHLVELFLCAFCPPFCRITGCENFVGPVSLFHKPATVYNIFSVLRDSTFVLRWLIVTSFSFHNRNVISLL